MNEQDKIAYENYMRSQGLMSVDIGSVTLLRKEINKQLAQKGYKKLKGYKSKKQLRAIISNI